jgi:hypothetical protein
LIFSIGWRVRRRPVTCVIVNGEEEEEEFRTGFATCQVRRNEWAEGKKIKKGESKEKTRKRKALAQKIISKGVGWTRERVNGCYCWAS